MEHVSMKYKLRMAISSYHQSILLAFVDSLTKDIKGHHFCGPFFLPYVKKIFCVLRSPFVNKDSRDHFELRLYSVVFYSKFSTEENLLKFLKTFFKKLSFKITNNISIKVEKI